MSQQPVRRERSEDEKTRLSVPSASMPQDNKESEIDSPREAVEGMARGQVAHEMAMETKIIAEQTAAMNRMRTEFRQTQMREMMTQLGALRHAIMNPPGPDALARTAAQAKFDVLMRTSDLPTLMDTFRERTQKVVANKKNLNDAQDRAYDIAKVANAIYAKPGPPTFADVSQISMQLEEMRDLGKAVSAMHDSYASDYVLAGLIRDGVERIRKAKAAAEEEDEDDDDAHTSSDESDDDSE